MCFFLRESDVLFPLLLLKIWYMLVMINLDGYISPFAYLDNGQLIKLINILTHATENWAGGSWIN